MAALRAFPALRPRPDAAARVASVPYDVVDAEEARALAAGNPDSFLYVVRPEIGLPPDADPHGEQAYRRAAEALAALTGRGLLARDPEPALYVYRLERRGRAQTGVVGCCAVDEYDAGAIRRHEHTRPDKERDRARHALALAAHAGPVFIAYRGRAEIDRRVAAAAGAAPLYDFTAADGVRHAVWRLAGAAADGLAGAFAAVPALYIADGHHRSASASRIAAARRAANPTHSGEEAYNFFLSVIFPAHEMRIMDYNRVITDLNGLSAASFLERIGGAFSVETSSSAVKPERPGVFGLYLAGRWYRLSIRPDLIPADPVGRLDVSLLQNNLIAPILGIDDPRRDRRIDFVGGIRGLPELEKRVNSGEMALALALHPTRMDDLMAVADANEVMPPKSTWFEPKLADGLASHVLDSIRR